MNRWLGALVMAALVLPNLAGAEVYRWVDKNGKVNYSDVPPPDMESQTRKMIDNRIEVDKLPYELRKAVEQSPLTLYTAPQCKEVCEAARKYLQGRKLPFTEKSVQTAEELQALSKLTGKKEPVAPTLQIGSKTLEGFEESAWASTLNIAGYPKTAP